MSAGADEKRCKKVPGKLPPQASASKPAGAADGRDVVFSFEKNARERVIASLSHFRGELYLDVRVWFEGSAGEYLPTKKGITIHPECLGDLERAVAALREAVEARGLAA